MAVIDNNILATNSFSVAIGATKQFPKLNYFAVSVTFPGITNDEVATQYRNRPGYVPSETLKYEPLQLRFLCDEKMKVYDELYNWMRTNVDTDKHSVADIEVSLMTSHNNISRTIVCTRAFPTSISSVEFNAQSEAMEFATFDVSFRFDDFSMR